MERRTSLPRLRSGLPLSETHRDCHRHPGVAGTNSCGVCLRPICDACLSWANLEPACPSCSRKKRDRTGARQLLIVGGVVLVGCSGIATAALLYKKPFDYGAQSGTVIVLKQELEKSPCDRTAIVKLGETMSLAGDRRGSLERANDWLERCGEYERLRWVTYAAHRDLHDEAGAIREATRLIEIDPDDKDYYWWRGIIYERDGELRKAAADYEKSLEIEPRLTGIPFNLADMYERLGNPCDAVVPLDRFVALHPETTIDARTSHRITRLHEECDASVPAGETAAAPAAGRVDLDGATIRLPDGFAPLPPGSHEDLGGAAAKPARSSKGFVRVNGAGDTLVLFRVIDEATPDARLTPQRISAELDRMGRSAGGRIIRSQSKRASRTLEVGLSFNRDRNAGEWRALAGHLEGAPVLRTWTIHCEDRPSAKSEDCQQIVRSLEVPDTGTLRLLSDVYPE